jgi:hypothetical protein
MTAVWDVAGMIAKREAGSGSLSADELSIIAQWIADGAPAP